MIARDIETMGRRSLAISGDVTNDGDIEGAVEKTRHEFGRIDYVVANAGFGVAGRFGKLTIEDFRRQFETNVFGVLRTIYATKDLLIASRGCIAIMGSVNGYIALPRLAAYSMSKFAIHGLADSLRHEMRPHGVDVVLIAPGFVRTEIRHIDKTGIYRSEIKDRIPPWLQISAERAARETALAMHRRRPVKVITNHARIAILLQRHCPRLLSAVLYSLSKRGLLI
jgi:NAD(P)-dependent dehydrogenase (short-subunit alcohol dehydrogenase family)